MIEPMDMFYLKEVEDWYADRKMDTPGSYPQVGLIYPGVAAGWLGQTDFGVCFLENLISNPNVSKELSDEALDKLVEALILKARDLRYDTIVGLTKIPAVMARAAKHGMVNRGHFALYHLEN